MTDRRAEATRMYNQAVTAANDRTQASHLQLAYQLFGAACFHDPTFAEAWYQLGCANYDMGMLPAATAAWRRALTCDNAGLRPKILGNLGWTIHTLGGRTVEALKLLEEAVRLDPSLHKVWFSLACVYTTLGRMHQAVAAGQRAMMLAPQDIETEMALAFALLFSRRWAEGLKHFEARFPHKLHNYLKFPYPKWLGEPDRTVFLVADQGLGDTLSFARFLPVASARAKYIHALIQPALLRSFTYAFADLPNVDFMPDPSPFPMADAWTTFVSLPFALGLSDIEIEGTPTPTLPVFSYNDSWKVPQHGLHIGIAWAGSPLNDIDKWRNLPLTELADLYRVPNIQLYSLQVGGRAKELHESGCGNLIRDLAPWINDVADTVALLQHLDLVITCESGLGHICGAIGKECWIPYSWDGRDYRLGPKGQKPLWYPGHRVFPQGPDAQWGPVFREIAGELRKRTAMMEAAE